MRILHVGSGFRPWRRGGLVAYVEDLIGEQARRGDEVAYLFSGRQYPLVRGPRLRRWRGDGGAQMLEIVNSPLYDHGRQPQLELDEPRTERLFEGAVRELRPDVVHVHELAGLPSSVIDVVQAAGAPVVVTLQDYFPLCPTFRLLDADGRVCLRREIGADCVRATAADPRPPGLMVEATVRHDLAPLARTRVTNAAVHMLARGVARAATPRPAPASAAAFQRRREVNVERLGRADRLIAMSTRVAEIYEALGVDASRMTTLQLTLSHIERLRPRPARDGRPLTFATLAGFESPAKGARLLLAALRRLPADGRFRLIVLGHVDPAFAGALRELPGVELRGLYRPDDLDGLLDDVDVGIVPSVWEEAYAYAGVEFLAKGIPVIANAIGGMPDYTREGETGWLNRSLSADELARIMGALVDEPARAFELAQRVRAARASIVKTLAAHAQEMEAVYRSTIER